MFTTFFRSLKILWKLFRTQQRENILLALLLCIFSAFFELLSVASIGRLFLAAEGNQGRVYSRLFNIFNFEAISLNQWLIVFIVIIVFSGLLKSFYTYYSWRTVAKLGAYLSQLVFKKEIRQDYQTYLYSNSSTAVSLISKQVEHCMDILIHMFQFTSYSISALALLIAIANILPISSLLFLFAIPFSYLFLIKILKNRTNNIGKSLSRTINREIQFTQEAILMYKDIIINKNHLNIENEFYSYDFKRRSLEAETAYIGSIPRDLIGTISIVVLILIALLSYGSEVAYLLPSLASLGLACQKLIPAFQGMYSSLIIVSSYSDSLRQVASHSSSEKLIEKNKNLVVFKSFKNFSAKDLSFNYVSKNHPIIKKKSFNINKGEFIAIKGDSGSGKSTLMDICLGLSKPLKGSIMINDNSLDNCLGSWHDLISYVGQAVFLIDSTVENNLFLGSKKNLQSKYTDLIFTITGLKKMFKEKEIQLQSRVGESGRLLSRGQRQRIGLARALLRNPKVLFLDEATNGLEYKSELEIYKNLRESNRDITLVAITHSQNLDNCFDKIINM